MAESQETEESVIDDTPAGQHRRWMMEFKAAKKAVQKWHEQGDRIIKRFLDERDDDDSHAATRVNLYTANIQTVRAIMYGKTPKVDCSRRFSDSSDDVARVSAEVFERILNSDIEDDGDGFAEACGSALDDRLNPGLGVVRVRYEVEMGQTEGQEAILHPQTGVEMAPAIPPAQVKQTECVETDYVYWKDFLWDPARTWKDVRWVAFRVQMSRKALKERFPEVGDLVPLNSQRNGEAIDAKKNTPWGRADIWEVWSKDDSQVYWVSEAYHEVLDTQEDPLGLDGFFPCARPMFANVTTSRLLPRPDFVLAQDLYDEVDTVSTRITLLERAIVVRGIYDVTAGPEIGRMLSEAGLNELIPVKNWPMLQEKGGVAGLIQWMPLDQVVAALDKLREYRTELTSLLYQVTGMSDIIRGQAQTQTTATEQSIKAKFASVRLQALQDEFARFCSDTQRLKAEIISKHFDERTLVEAANMAYTPDSQQPGLVEAAVRLIKSNHFAYRVEVKPESVSLSDYAALKQERTEVMQAIGGYLQMAAPLAMQAPQMAPMLMQLLQWLVSGIRGAQEIEGILDQTIAQAQTAAAQPAPQQQQHGPDPKIVATQMKGQMDIQKAQFDHHASMQQIQAQAQADALHQQNQTKFNLIESAEKERQKAVADVSALTGRGGMP
jgi:hypothetical protein